MLQVDRQTILALTQTRNQLSSLRPGEKEIIIQSGASLEAVFEEVPEACAEVRNALMLSLQALQVIFLEETADFERMLKAVLGALIASEQVLGAPPNPITELMLDQALTVLRAELGAVSQNQTENLEESEEIAETEFTASLETLDDVSVFLIQLELSDKAGLENACAALKTISNGENDKEKRKLIVKAARELTKIISGKANDDDAAFQTVSELIDQANFCEESFDTPEVSELKTGAPIVSPVKEESKPAPESSNEYPLEVFEPDTLPVDSDTGLVAEFVVESYELMEAAEGALLALETEPENIENVNTVFRAFHTVKGSAAYLGLKRLTELAHHAESLLSRIRDREIQCSGGYANLALRSLDTLKSMLNGVERNSVGMPMPLPESFAELITILKNPEAHGVSGEAVVQFQTIEPKQAEPEIPEEVEKDFVRIGEVLISMGKITERQLKWGLANKGEKLIGDFLVDEGIVAREDISEALLKQTITNQNKAALAESSVRVRTDRLDSLIDMVGELVIAQSMLAQDSTVTQGIHPELSRKISHAGKIVRELQDLSMGMRMIPLKTTFQKMARLVRDVSQKCGKQVEFVTEGEDTEIDRNMVDLIADPLVHMVRNAVDHGIETPETRQATEKAQTGKVRLAAYHAGGDVVVELTDDGAGLDRDKLVAKAIAKNLIESDKGMSENEIFRLIFAPGFSTAETITDVSGRGVGMDVVRRNIEAMRGRIEITSEKGKGSVFTIRLPLTLAITDGMLVRVGTERYIVPTVNIQLSFQPNQKMLSSVAERGELVSLRGELMPVFRLHQLFDVKDAIENPTEGLLMIVADGRRRCALLVDELLGQQQVVTKTLGEGVGKIPGVSGGAILGDGCVGLILDTAEIVAIARQTTSAKVRKDEPQKLAA